MTEEVARLLKGFLGGGISADSFEMWLVENVENPTFSESERLGLWSIWLELLEYAEGRSSEADVLEKAAAVLVALGGGASQVLTGTSSSGFTQVIPRVQPVQPVPV